MNYWDLIKIYLIKSKVISSPLYLSKEEALWDFSHTHYHVKQWYCYGRVVFLGNQIVKNCAYSVPINIDVTIAQQRCCSPGSYNSSASFPQSPVSLRHRYCDGDISYSIRPSVEWSYIDFEAPWMNTAMNFDGYLTHIENFSAFQMLISMSV